MFSDIDDTIKVTDVILHGELIENSLMRPFRAGLEMAALVDEQCRQSRAGS